MQYKETEQGIPIVIPSEKADLFDKIKPEEHVESMRHKLLGESKINGKWVRNSFMAKRRLSEVGAWEISSLMLAASSQNVAISKLNSSQIKNRLLNLACTAQKMCLRNWREYNIRGVDQLNFVHEIVFTNTLATLNQPEGEGIRKLLGTVGSVDFTPQEAAPMGLDVFRRLP